MLVLDQVTSRSAARLLSSRPMRIAHVCNKDPAPRTRGENPVRARGENPVAASASSAAYQRARVIAAIDMENKQEASSLIVLPPCMTDSSSQPELKPIKWDLKRNPSSSPLPTPSAPPLPSTNNFEPTTRSRLFHFPGLVSLLD